ncbi:MAG: diacylglycerol kinase family protein [Gemmatimonadales bacterium]
MTRALIITNPAAARTAEPIVQTVMETLRDGGWQVELRATGGPGDARRFAAEGVAAGVDVVGVFGGDGTTMQAAAALVGSSTSLGLIPGGTGNILAGNLRVPNDPGKAARIMLDGRVVPIDLGRMERADGPHYFAVACGAGFDARVMAETSTAAKHRWRFAAYVATVFRLLPDLRNLDHLITVDGVEYEAKASLVLVANCGEVIPPLVRLRRGIALDDGLLDVVVLRADSLFSSVAAVWQLLRNGGALGAGSGRVGYARGREVTVESHPPQPVQLDGEPHGTTPFTATVVHGAIRVLAPESR